MGKLSKNGKKVLKSVVENLYKSLKVSHNLNKEDYSIVFEALFNKGKMFSDIVIIIDSLEKLIEKG